MRDGCDGLASDKRCVPVFTLGEDEVVRLATYPFDARSHLFRARIAAYCQNVITQRNRRPPMATENLSTRLAQLKPQLEQEYPISELGIFGSYARGEQQADSDLDILVAFEQPVTLFDLVRLENELAEELGIEVDLVTKDSLKPRIETRVRDDLVTV